MTLDHAKVVIAQFRKEINTAASNGQVVQASLNAIKDVLSQTHPDLIADLEQVDTFAQDVGYSLGEQVALASMLNQFVAALPADVRAQLGGP